MLLSLNFVLGCRGEKPAAKTEPAAQTEQVPAAEPGLAPTPTPTDDVRQGVGNVDREAEPKPPVIVRAKEVRLGDEPAEGKRAPLRPAPRVAAVPPRRLEPGVLWLSPYDDAEVGELRVDAERVRLRSMTAITEWARTEEGLGPRRETALLDKGTEVRLYRDGTVSSDGKAVLVVAAQGRERSHAIGFRHQLRAVDPVHGYAFITTDSALAAIRLSSGRRRWRTALPFDEVGEVFVSPDGGHVLVLDENGGMVAVFEAATGERVASRRHTGAIVPLSDGRLAKCDGDAVDVVSIGGESLARIEGVPKCERLGVDSTGVYLAAAGDAQVATFAVRDLKPVATFRFADAMERVVPMSDGRGVAIANGRGVEVLHLDHDWAMSGHQRSIGFASFFAGDLGFVTHEPGLALFWSPKGELRHALRVRDFGVGERHVVWTVPGERRQLLVATPDALDAPVAWTLPAPHALPPFLARLPVAGTRVAIARSTRALVVLDVESGDQFEVSVEAPVTFTRLHAHGTRFVARGLRRALVLEPDGELWDIVDCDILHLDTVLDQDRVRCRSRRGPLSVWGLNPRSPGATLPDGTAFASYWLDRDLYVQQEDDLVAAHALPSGDERWRVEGDLLGMTDEHVWVESEKRLRVLDRVSGNETATLYLGEGDGVPLATSGSLLLTQAWADLHLIDVSTSRPKPAGRDRDVSTDTVASPAP